MTREEIFWANKNESGKFYFVGLENPVVEPTTKEAEKSEEMWPFR